MRIALDGTPLAGPAGGIRRYTEELARALAEEFPADEIATLMPAPGRWWTVGVQLAMRRARIDVFHGTDFAVPYLPLRPAVVTIHDLSPFRPEWRDEVSERVRRRAPWVTKLGLADMTITPTEAVRRCVIEELGLHPASVVAVPHGVADIFHPDPVPRPHSDFFLVAGAVHGRKNLAAVAAATRSMSAPPRVVAAGEVREGCREPGIEYAGRISDLTMAELYRGAAALLFPSLYEGFGLPLLEAMACGTPVIASTDPALREVSGGAAIHVDTADVRGWAAAMTAVLRNNGLRVQLREAGLRRSAAFTWRGCARMTRAVYAEAVRRHG